MKHRHIDDEGWSLAALNSLFERGDLPDFKELYQALLLDDSGELEKKLLHVAKHQDAALPLAEHMLFLAKEERASKNK